MLAIVRISREYLLRFQYDFKDTPLLTKPTCELFRNFETGRPT